MSYDWARKLTAMGHEVYLIPPGRIKAFLCGQNKTDANDAEAICMAGQNPNTRFVSIKTEEQQCYDHILSRREMLVATRTKIANQTRSFFAEHGRIFPQGIESFINNLPQYIVDNYENIPPLLKEIVVANYDDIKYLNEKILELDKRINELCEINPLCGMLMAIPGIGPITAYSILSVIGDALQFSNGRQMACYFGVVPREHSTGGRQYLGRITKRGNNRIRVLLFLAARNWIISLRRRKKNDDGTPVNPYTYRESWALDLAEAKGLGKASIALANRMCRMIWAMVTRGECFDRERKPWPAKSANAA